MLIWLNRASRHLNARCGKISVAKDQQATAVRDVGEDFVYQDGHRNLDSSMRW